MNENDFSHHLRVLASGDDDDDESLRKTLKKIRRILGNLLKARRMWWQSPRWQALPYDHWGEPGALEELVHDAYHEALLAPAKALQALLDAGARSVDAAVARNLDHFLTRRQRNLDPLGFRVYSITLQVFESLVATGQAKVSPPGDIGNGSRLILERGSWRKPIEDQCEQLARDWGHGLMPDLLTARHGRPKKDLLDRLAALVSDLGNRHSVPFAEVVAGLRRGARELSGQLVSPTDDPGPEWLGALRLENTENAGARYLALVGCIDHGIPTLAPTPKTRGHLERLWHFIQQWALEEDTGGFPSNRRLEDLLKIPRQTIHRLFDYLAAQLGDCLRVVDRGSSSPSGDQA